MDIEYDTKSLHAGNYQLMLSLIKNPPVRSYVIRQGRMTKGQARALEAIWPTYGVECKAGQQFDFKALFGRDAPVICEVGFGNGHSLHQMSLERPDWNFLGIEVHRPGVGSLLLQLERDKMANVRIVCEDAVVVLAQAIPEASLHRFHLFFPDPWPKKRHHKRRIVTPGFADLVAARLQPDQGIFHLATDWEDYAEQALMVLENCKHLQNVHMHGGYVRRPDWRPKTRFERRGLSHGHRIYDIQMRRI